MFVLFTAQIGKLTPHDDVVEVGFSLAGLLVGVLPLRCQPECAFRNAVGCYAGLGIIGEIADQYSLVHFRPPRCRLAAHILHHQALQSRIFQFQGR